MWNVTFSLTISSFSISRISLYAICQLNQMRRKAIPFDWPFPFRTYREERKNQTPYLQNQWQQLVHPLLKLPLLPIFHPDFPEPHRLYQEGARCHWWVKRGREGGGGGWERETSTPHHRVASGIDKSPAIKISSVFNWNELIKFFNKREPVKVCERGKEHIKAPS